MNPILTAALAIGLLGMVLGAVLAFASKIFHVEKDPRVEEILEVLPGANCGGCGFAGCAAVAEAIAVGKAPVNACPVGGADVAGEVAKIMGIEAGEFVKTVSFVRCHACKEDCKQKFEYYGELDCVQAESIMGGNKACENGCLGYGSCVKVCQFDAIFINDKGIAEIDPEKCTSCGACMKVCPRHVISLTLYNKNVHVTCNNTKKGKDVKLACDVGCIACGICVKSCPFEAITMNKDKNLPEIDYNKCRECAVCVEKCPTHCMIAQFERKHAFIDEEKCIKCGLCKKACPVDAIEGELKQTHTVITEKCIGCKLCAEKCKKDAISFK